MDTNELKKMLKGSIAVLILDNGEPSFVILGYDSYKKLLSDRSNVDPPDAEVVPIRVERPASRGDDRAEPNERQFQHRNGQFQERVGEKEAELLEKINKEILFLKSEIEKEEKGASVVPG